MKTEKLNQIIHLLDAALKANAQNETSTVRGLLRDARGMLNTLGEHSPIQSLKRAVSDYLTPNYFQWENFWNGLNAILESRGFNPVSIPSVTAGNITEGRVNFEVISKDETTQTFLLIAWHFMERSQKYEFTGYVHP